MKILITGANGYVGKTLNKAFKGKYDVILLTRQMVDLYDFNQVKEFFKKFNFPQIFFYFFTYSHISTKV